MSMWLNLAKITPALLAEVRAHPELLDGIFGEEPGFPGFDPRADVFGCDYRTLSAVAEGMAADEGAREWREHCVWLAVATGDTADETLADYDFGYGLAFVHDPARVVRAARGLADEGWGTAVAQTGPYDDFDGLGPFYAAAAREGKAVVGGVS